MKHFFIRHTKGILLSFTLIIIILGSLTVFYRKFLSDKDSASSAVVKGIAAKVLPKSDEDSEKDASFLDLAQYFSGFQGEKKFLLLFQNNFEIRPGGGYLGSIGIVKVKDGGIVFFETYGTEEFDDLVNTNIDPPYPISEWFSGVKDWELRDSNWSPDFRVNALRAIEFYNFEKKLRENRKYMDESIEYRISNIAKNSFGKINSDFDAVIAINTNVLVSFLDVIGPVDLPKFGGEYNKENAIEKLQSWVELDYKDAGIRKNKRKSVLQEFSKVITNRVQSLGNIDKLRLIGKMKDQLDEKNIMIYSFDDSIQKELEKRDWAGRMQENCSIQNSINSSQKETVCRDYLMLVDANISSFKTDAHIKRTISYSVDFSHDNDTKVSPLAKVWITYEHTADEADWKTRGMYRSYSRLYVPYASWLEEIAGNWEADWNEEGPCVPEKSANKCGVQFSKELGKTVFGFDNRVYIGSKNTVMLKYRLPEYITEENYKLMWQKQSGAQVKLVKN